MTSLFLLRHGPTAASDGGAPLGHLDVPVTQEGQARWPRVKAKLLEFGIERVLCSDLRRVHEHALELGLSLLVSPALREQDFGKWDGIPWSELENTQAFFADPIHNAAPDGESFAGCAHRVFEALKDIPYRDSTWLVFAHGGPLRAVLSRFLGMPLERALDLSWQPFGLTRLDVYAADRAGLAYHNRALG